MLLQMALFCSFLWLCSIPCVCVCVHARVHLHTSAAHTCTHVCRNKEAEKAAETQNMENLSRDLTLRKNVHLGQELRNE